MNKDILETGPQGYIENNWNTDILSLLLKKPIFPNISQQELVEQLEAKKKCQYKLPTWFHHPKIYYPNKLNIEQTSSEKTAAYKARLVDGKSLLDMTGGLGVDSFYFSKKIERITHCEVNQQLSEIAAHNFRILGVSNCDFVAGNGMEFLERKRQRFDWIYVDPSRRNDVKGKVFRLEDGMPNIPQNLDLIFEHTDSVLLKTSPLLDLTMAMNTLKHVAQIHVVAVQNEVKEVLFILKKEVGEPLSIKTIDLRKDKEVRFEFPWDDEKTVGVEYGEPETYLYEPNAAILKAGGFNSVAQSLKLKKIAPHSHLYTSRERIDFPGRTFEIKEVLPYNKKSMKALLGTKANITIRNFPETVAQLRKKHWLSDGGDGYLFFTLDKENKKKVLKCAKL